MTVVAVRAPRLGTAMMRARTSLRAVIPFALGLLVTQCRCDAAEESPPVEPSASGSAPPPSPSVEPPPQLLYLPDGGDVAPTTAPGDPRVQLGSPPASRCPSEMVGVRGQFCIDRYEVVDRI